MGEAANIPTWKQVWWTCGLAMSLIRPLLTLYKIFDRTDFYVFSSKSRQLFWRMGFIRNQINCQKMREIEHWELKMTMKRLQCYLCLMTLWYNWLIIFALEETTGLSHQNLQDSTESKTVAHRDVRSITGVCLSETRQFNSLIGLITRLVTRELTSYH